LDECLTIPCSGFIFRHRAPFLLMAIKRALGSKTHNTCGFRKAPVLVESLFKIWLDLSADGRRVCSSPGMYSSLICILLNFRWSQTLRGAILIYYLFSRANFNALRRRSNLYWFILCKDFIHVFTIFTQKF
jgi:hypothetical protein